jgi:hypothetical protein
MTDLIIEEIINFYNKTGQKKVRAKPVRQFPTDWNIASGLLPT